MVELGDPAHVVVRDRRIGMGADDLHLRAVEAREQLVRERDLLRMVIDNLPVEIYAKDREGRFVLNNMAHARVFGVSSPRDLVGKSDLDFFPRDLALQLQVLAALLTDPGYRREGEERFRKGIDNYFATLDATPRNALGTALGGILSDNDPRFTLQPKEAFLALDYAGLKAAIGDRLASGAIELALAGDFDEAEAISAVAATFGALPGREPEFNPRNEARTRSFTATRGRHVLTHTGEADLALLQWTWPTTDDSDLAETLRLGLLINEFRSRVDEPVRIVVGAPIARSEIAARAGAAKAMMDFLRRTTYELSPDPLPSLAYGYEFEEKYRA
jgi:PAS domain S-box-containing protein